MGRRHSDKVISKDDILKAATHEFIEQGFYGARIDQIAKTGKFNKAMIYYYFKDKQSIYEEVLRTVVREVLDQLNAPTDDLKTMENLVGKIYDAYANVASTKMDLVKLFLYEIVRGGETLKRMDIIHLSDVPFNPINGKFYHFIQKQIKQGLICKMDTFQILLSILGQIITIVIMNLIRDIVKGKTLPIDPTMIFAKLSKQRRTFIINFTMQALKPNKGGIQ